MEKVVCSFAIVVTLSTEENEDRELEVVSRKVLQLLEAEFGDSTCVELQNAASFVWFNEANCNIHTCRECGRVFSAENLPERVEGLAEGTCDSVLCHCLECKSFNK
jgi:hypothetical protein